MMAVAGSRCSFDHGREQLKRLAGLKLISKAVERHAEAIRADLAVTQQAEMERAVQLEFPEILGEAVPVLYIEMDGTGVPVVKAETEGRSGKNDGQPAHTREVKLDCMFTQTSTAALHRASKQRKREAHRSRNLSRRTRQRKRRSAGMQTAETLSKKTRLIASGPPRHWNDNQCYCFKLPASAIYSSDILV